jgi:hypothetical protein
MTITKEDEKQFRSKQLELGLTDEQCSQVVEYLKVGFAFPDAMIEFEAYVLDYLDKNHEQKG